MSVTPPQLEKQASSSDEKPELELGHGNLQAGNDDFEIFKVNTAAGEANYRTVGWLRATAIFIKTLFAIGVLSIPYAFSQVGAVPGALMIIGFGCMNGYFAIILGQFRNKYPGMHSIADMCNLVGGPIFREIVGISFALTFTLVTSAGIQGISVAFNTFSNHGTCTVWYVFAAFVITTAMACFPRFQEIGVISWIGTFSIILSILIVTVGVGVRDRPYAAPAGVTDFGFKSFGNPTFNLGITAASIIFGSTSGHSAFIPVIAEMRNPKDYNKAVLLNYTVTNVCYLVFSLIIFKYCGDYVASPSLGSAGPTLQKVCYGVGFFGLLASTMLYLHCASKYIFVRLVRNTRHLQEKTGIHWATWLGSTITLGIIAFILAEAVPIFNFLIALVSSLCLAPIAICLPTLFYLYMHWEEIKAGSVKHRALGCMHVVLHLVGWFMCIGGTYATVVGIRAAYADGSISGIFSCADNSGLGGMA